MNQWYLNPVGGYLSAIALAIMLLVVLVMVGLPLSGALTRGRRRTLLALRVAVLVLMALALLRPALIHSQTKKQTATLVLLVDRSRSMQVADAVNAQSRWTMLRNVLANALPALKELSAELEVKIYTFDSDVQPVEFSPDNPAIELGGPPSGMQTAIGAALEEVLRRESNKRLAGVILLSDGAQRAYAPHDLAPQTPARRMADLGCPLYAMTFGQSRGASQARDVALKDLLANQTVYVKNQLTAAGSARLDGYTNQPVPVQLLLENGAGKMEVVATRELRSTADGQSLPFELATVPQVSGEFKLTMRVEKQPGELVGTNNELSTFITVMAGGLNVLYLEGDLRIEQKFLRRSLDASPDIRVDYLRVVDRDPKQRGVNLQNLFKRGKYDVYLLGDIDSSAFTAEELQALATVVKDGAGLMMMGGYHTFGPGGYLDTPLAAVLPIVMNRLERQGLDEKIRADVHIPGPIQMLPARPMGLRHYAMSIGPPSENLKLWQDLPPLDGANRFAEVKRTGQVLAETADRAPLLVVNEAGGRVMALAVDSTWHWWMRGFESAHKRFWRQVILWLARKDETSEGNVWVKLDQRRFGPNARVEFKAGARNPQGEDLPDATFQVDIITPNNTKLPVRLTRQGESNVGTFLETAEAGDYTIQVTAIDGGVQLGKAKARFLVYQQDLELDNAAADPTLLGSLSKITEQAGGKTVAPELLAELLKQIQSQPLELEVQTEVKHTPWNTWPFFLLFVGLLSADWYLRKKWGLV